MRCLMEVYDTISHIPNESLVLAVAHQRRATTITIFTKQHSCYDRVCVCVFELRIPLLFSIWFVSHFSAFYTHTHTYTKRGELQTKTVLCNSCMKLYYHSTFAYNTFKRYMHRDKASHGTLVKR